MGCVESRPVPGSQDGSLTKTAYGKAWAMPINKGTWVPATLRAGREQPGSLGCDRADTHSRPVRAASRHPARGAVIFGPDHRCVDLHDAVWPPLDATLLGMCFGLFPSYGLPSTPRFRNTKTRGLHFSARLPTIGISQLRLSLSTWMVTRPGAFSRKAPGRITVEYRAPALDSRSYTSLYPAGFAIERLPQSLSPPNRGS